MRDLPGENEAKYYETTLIGSSQVNEETVVGNAIGVAGHNNRLILRGIAAGEHEVHIWGHHNDIEVQSDEDVTLYVHFHTDDTGDRTDTPHHNRIEGASQIVVQRDEGHHNTVEEKRY